MILLELLDIDILYHLTAPPSKHPLQSPSSVKSTTSRFTTIVQEIKKQLPPPSPTSPINHQTTPTPIPMVQMAQTLTPTTLLPSSSAASITSPPDAMADTMFACGQVYVAFSRATSWENLDLYAFEEDQIHIDQEVITENQRLWSLFIQRFPQQ